MNRKITRRVVVAAIGAALLPATASAQQFPTKPISFVVGYTAGGQADALARAVAARLSENLKQPVVVDNKPGANGLLPLRPSRTPGRMGTPSSSSPTPC